MDAFSPTAVPADTRQAAVPVVLLSLCGIIFCDFLIAATIVLVLIPIYLPTKSVTRASTTNQPLFIIGDFNGALSNGSTLDTAARMIEQQLGLPNGSVLIQNNVAPTGSNGRK